VTAETYKSVIYGTTYILASDLNEVHEKIKIAVLSQAGIDFTSEPLVAICALDGWPHGVFWSVVTPKTILTKFGTLTSQNLFIDVTGVERKGINIEILSPGNRSNIFSSWSCFPSQDLVESFYQIIKKTWLKSRESQKSSETIYRSDTLIDSIERLKSLLESGYITEQEFQVMKKKVFSQADQGEEGVAL
jgi:hypothetical protein